MSVRRRSWVWDFAKKSVDAQDAICNICEKSIRSNNSTSAIGNHLKFVHSVRPADHNHKANINSSSNEGSISEETRGIEETVQLFPRPNKWKRQNTEENYCSAGRQEEISQALARLIATNMLPTSIVSSDGFRDFMKVVVPGYKVPCDQTIRSRLQLMYNTVKEKISEEMAQAESISIVTDEWSSRTQDCYISVEAQYINAENKLSKATLCNVELEERPTAENISSAIEIVMGDWDLSDKVHAITHDSASVMIAAANGIDNIVNSVKCNAHLFQLVVKDALASVPLYGEICKKARRLSKYFHKSNIAKKALTQRQSQLSIKEERLVQSCETRWNSSLHMCESILRNKDAISLVLGDRSVVKANVALTLEITQKEWSDMENIVSVLKPFDKATTLVCSENSVTLSAIRPLVRSIINNHMAESISDDTNMKIFKEQARTSLQLRYDIDLPQINAALISSLLDPRYKNLNYEEKETKKAVIEHVKNMLNERYPVQCLEKSAEIETDLDFLFKDAEKIESDALSQFRNYLSEPQIGHNQDPLCWWNIHMHIYPEIFKLAMKYLSIPASSAASERTFPIAGNIITSRRSCLLPENVNLLTFLYQNRRFM